MKLKRFLYLVILTLVFFIHSIGQYKEVIIRDTATLTKFRNLIPVLVKGNRLASLAHSYMYVADYYYLKNQKDSAVKYYLLAHQKFETTGDSFYIYKCRHRIGAEISLNSDIETSLFWLSPALDYFAREKVYVFAAHIANDIGNVYRSAGNQFMWKSYVGRAELYNSYAKDTLLSIIIHVQLASNHRKSANTGLSIAESRKALQLARQSGYKFFEKISLLLLADNYLVQDSLLTAEKVLAEASELNHRGVQTEQAFHQTILYIKKGQKEKALNEIHHYRRLVDSIIRVKDKEKYVEQITRFETEKKQAFIASLEKENKLKSELAERRETFIYTLIAGLLILICAGWYIIYGINKRKKLELELLKQEEQFTKNIEKEKNEKIKAEFNKQLAEVQLTALNAQMSPHFIFNCMNSIQKYVLKNEKEKALGFLHNFSELMRVVLDNSVKPKVQLDEEIKMLDKYILLEQQRLDYHFTYCIDVDKTLQTDFFEIPGMIIQPYVENAIWHGLMNRTDNQFQGSLNLSFSREDDYIKCVITDNGVGREKAAELAKSRSPGHKSYGMAISQKRLELLKMDEEQLPRELVEDLYCNGQPCGTRVTLNIYVS